MDPTKHGGIRKTSHTKLIIMVSLSSIVSFTVVGVISYYELTEFMKHGKLTEHSEQVIKQFNVLDASILYLEDMSRGYIITGNPVFLTPFNATVLDIRSHVDSIHELAGNDPAYASDASELALLVEKRIEYISANDDLQKAGDVAGVTKRVTSLEGQKLMDDTRQKIADMSNKEYDLLQVRLAELDASYRNSVITVVLGTVIAIMITGTSKFIMYKKMKKSDKIEEENIGLHVETEKLKESDKVKSEFAAMVSHELKTPLVTIRGYAEMLKHGMLGILNKEQADAVDKIDLQTTRLERLISDVLDAQKMEMQQLRLDRRQFDVDKFMDEQIEIHSKIMDDKKIHFVNTTGEKITMSSDRGRLSQVFANLIKNSVDFVPESDGKIEINAQKKDGQVIFYVKDNGAGIAQEKQGNLFKKFYQVDSSLKRRHGGTGLGLVICKGIVEALGGKIWFKSREGEGTTFWFSLPVDEIVQVQPKGEL